ncbi:MAG: hypothetical protein HDR88_13870 [Bacteroides sp.]|nr:hypothetical protein [Bacteroides sp.]
MMLCLGVWLYGYSFQGKMWGGDCCSGAHMEDETLNSVGDITVYTRLMEKKEWVNHLTNDTEHTTEYMVYFTEREDTLNTFYRLHQSDRYKGLGVNVRFSQDSRLRTYLSTEECDTLIVRDNKLPEPTPYRQLTYPQQISLFGKWVESTYDSDGFPGIRYIDWQMGMSGDLDVEIAQEFFKHKKPRTHDNLKEAVVRSRLTHDLDSILGIYGMRIGGSIISETLWCEVDRKEFVEHNAELSYDHNDIPKKLLQFYPVFSVEPTDSIAQPWLK